MLLLQTPPNQNSEPLLAIIQKSQEKPKEQLYIIKQNDSLTTIAEATHTTVERLWEKNTDLTSPDIIEPGKPLKIPQDSETLTDRPMPVIVESAPEHSGASTPRPTLIRSGGVSVSSGAYGVGNTYYAGQCVWYVKNQVGWVQNGWGNASDWKYTSGHTVSTIPAVGTVAWARSYGHVAIVTGVGTGTVDIIEMNYQGPYVVSSRTAPTSEFEYIYP